MRTPLALAAFACGVAVAFAASPARADIVGIVRGTVERTDRHPVSGAGVTLSGERTTLHAVSDARGRFAFARVPFGTYTLTAATPDGNAGTTVDVATNAVVDVVLRATPEIGRTAATTTGVRGAPVSQNVYGPRTLAALPRNTSMNAIVETVPGVVAFSYDEPVAHGFHGVTYELDGAPLPQSTSANFSQLIDPRDVSSVEIFTGAFPAEFGGARQGAVVNVASGLASADAGDSGVLTLGGGSQGAGGVNLVQHLAAGAARIGIAVDSGRTDRALDTPAQDAVHDASATSDAFVRITMPAGPRNLLAADLSAQTASFQIPINTNPNDPNSSMVSLPGTDDVQREDDRFASLSFTHTSKDGLGYVQILPWMRYTRVAYDGDTAADVQAYQVNLDGSQTFQNSLTQDRAATYAGLRASVYRASDRHAFKAGVDLSRENFRSTATVTCAPGNCLSGVFTDDSAQAGTLTGLYAEDKWTPNEGLAINAGLRYDHSTGYVGGSQLSPRLGVNQAIGNGTILHAYYGRLYAAPGLEDTRRDAVLTQTTSEAAPVYDLQPERDTYVELGIARSFGAGVRGYVNAFDRTATNVLDTTNLLNTPLFIVFNNTVGVDRGIEMRLTRDTPSVDAGLSFTYQRSLAGGISGSTFLLNGSANDITLQPEDHDQTYTGNVFLTRHFGAQLRSFATALVEYGTGFPVQFQNGNGRLPAHFIANVAFGRRPAQHGGVGYELTIDNLFDHRYLIKVNNGFNTTQWNAPRSVGVRVMLPW